jgi:hypothetical protein
MKYEIDCPLPFEQEKRRIRSWARRAEGATSASRIRAEDKKILHTPLFLIALDFSSGN